MPQPPAVFLSPQPNSFGVDEVAEVVAEFNSGLLLGVGGLNNLRRAVQLIVVLSHSLQQSRSRLQQISLCWSGWLKIAGVVAEFSTGLKNLGGWGAKYLRGEGEIVKALLNLGWNFQKPRWNFTETLLVQSWNCAGTRSGVPWGGSPEIIGGGYAGLIHALRACRGASRGPGYPLGLLEKRHGSYQTIARDDAAQQPRRGMQHVVSFRFAHGLGLQSVGSAAPVVTVSQSPLISP